MSCAGFMRGTLPLPQYAYLYGASVQRKEPSTRWGDQNGATSRPLVGTFFQHLLDRHRQFPGHPWFHDERIHA